MKIAPIRYAIGAFVFIAVAIGIAVNAGGGTLSGFGIADIVALCPLGSLWCSCSFSARRFARGFAQRHSFEN